MNVSITDLFDIIKIAIGAIMGFAFSIICSYRSRLCIEKGLKQKLIQELMEYKEYIKAKLEDPEIILRFYSPIWDLLKSSDSLLQLNDDEYRKIRLIYISMERLKELESSKEITSEQVPKIIELRKDLINTIENNELRSKIKGR